MAHTWQLKFFAYCILDIPLRLTHLLLSFDHSKNTATNTKFSDILSLYTGRLYSIDYSLFFPFLIFTRLIDYIKSNIQLKEAKQFHIADDNQ